MAGITKVSLALLLSGCYGTPAVGNQGKVNLYPTNSTWQELASGAAKLGWETKRREPGADYDLKVLASSGPWLELWDAPDRCEGVGQIGCEGLAFRCGEGVSKDVCTKQFMTLVESSGIDPAQLKLSNLGDGTERGARYVR